MNFEELLKQDKIQKIEKKEFDLALAERDLAASENNLKAGDYDWALSIAYNAVLQAGRALMFHFGYRPRGRDQHKTVFEFLEKAKIDDELTNYFNSIRKTRHIAVYDIAESVSETMAKETVEQANIFVQKIRTFVQKIRTEK